MRAQTNPRARNTSTEFRLLGALLLVCLPYFAIFVNVNDRIIVNKDPKTNARANEHARAWYVYIISPL